MADNGDVADDIQKQCLGALLLFAVVVSGSTAFVFKFFLSLFDHVNL